MMTTDGSDNDDDYGHVKNQSYFIITVGAA